MQRDNPYDLIVWGLVAAVGTLIVAAVWSSTPYELKGPESRSGVKSVVHVSQAGFHWGADFYCDVVLLDASGREVAKWNDPNGQGSARGARALHQSMRWSSETLLFEDIIGRNQLRVGDRIDIR